MLVHTYPYDKLDRLGAGATTAGQLGLPGVGGAATQHLAFAYWDTDEVKALTRPSGVSTHWSYRAMGPVSSIAIETSGSSPIETFTYPTHDELGNILSMTDADVPPENRTV